MMKVIVTGLDTINTIIAQFYGDVENIADVKAKILAANTHLSTLESLVIGTELTLPDLKKSVSKDLEK